MKMRFKRKCLFPVKPHYRSFQGWVTASEGGKIIFPITPPHQNGSFQSRSAFHSPQNSSRVRSANWSMMQFVTHFCSAVSVSHHQHEAIRARGHECLQLTDEKRHLCKCTVQNRPHPSEYRVVFSLVGSCPRQVKCEGWDERSQNK